MKRDFFKIYFYFLSIIGKKGEENAKNKGVRKNRTPFERPWARVYDCDSTSYIWMASSFFTLSFKERTRTVKVCAPKLTVISSPSLTFKDALAGRPFTET